MKATRFRTDKTLWERIALLILAVSWCIPVISVKSGPYFGIATALKRVVTAVYLHDASETYLLSSMFSRFAGASVVVAIVFGWILHCLVVIMRARKAERTEHAA